MTAYFPNVPNVGDLYLYKVIEEKGYPVIFLLKNADFSARYIGYCYNLVHIQRWILAKTNEKAIDGFLCGRLSLREIISQPCVYNVSWSKEKPICKYARISADTINLYLDSYK